MKKKIPKARNPNWITLLKLRLSNAMGNHGDKKKYTRKTKHKRQND